jgi:hypothetical protein
VANDIRNGEVIEAPARLAYGDRVDDGATARVRVRGHTARLRHAVLGGLACWGLAVVAVFVPFLHFVLVPSLLVAGPIVFFVRMGERVELLGARGTCPMCGHVQPFAEHGRLRAPHPLRCAGCGRQLALAVDVPGEPDVAPATSPPSVRVWVKPEDEAPGPNDAPAAPR